MENNKSLFLSETFSVNDFGTSFLILGFSDPHGLESWQRWQDWTTNPDQEFSFLRSENLDFHCWWSQSSNFFTKSFWDTWEHSCSTTHDDIVVQIFSNINITLKNWLISNFVETWHLFSDQHWLEKSLSASESLTADGNSLSVGKFINFIVLISLGII